MHHLTSTIFHSTLITCKKKGKENSKYDPNDSSSKSEDFRSSFRFLCRPYRHPHTREIRERERERERERYT
jgi:hypothetical protein